MERKAIPQYIKQIDDRTVIGVASVFGNCDQVGDVVLPGSFTKTLKERGGRFLHLWQHDDQQPPIAVIKQIIEVGRADLPKAVTAKAPDATGGLMVSREYLDTPRGNEVLAAIAAGSPLEMSYAYDALDYDYTEKDGRIVRMLKTQKLYETSDVNWGANDATVAAKRAQRGTPSAELVSAALKRLSRKSDFSVISTEAYDLVSGASVLSAIAMLVSSEGWQGDDPTAVESLVSMLRLLLNYLAGEVDDIAAAASATDVTPTSGMAARLAPGAIKSVYQQLSIIQRLAKAGARHSSADQKMVNAIHDMTSMLGATSCKGILGSDTDSQTDPNQTFDPTDPSIFISKGRAALSARTLKLMDMQRAIQVRQAIKEPS